MKIYKTKIHKPFTKKQIGKRLMFFRAAKASEIPILEHYYTSSGCFSFPHIKKDYGVLMYVIKTTKYSKHDKKISTSNKYEYHFKLKNGAWETSNCYFMDNGINKFGLVK